MFFMQVYDNFRERYFGPSFELQSHDKVSLRLQMYGYNVMVILELL